MKKEEKVSVGKTGQKKKKSFLKRFFISMISSFLILGLILGGGYYYIFGSMEQDEAMSDEDAGILSDQEYFNKNVVNIALFGVDTLDSSMVGRSDSIIIVSLDKKKKEIRLSAIQRDCYVEIDHPKRGKIQDKINHAYAFGGASLAVKTLNQNFGLDIKDYVVINFTNMEKVVDTLGGIQLEVSEAYRREANHHIGALAAKRKIEPDLIDGTGMQELNGMQVLGMLRARKQVGGVGVRSEMHEILLNACFEKIKTKSVLEYPAIAKSLLQLVKTTLTSGKIANTARSVVTGGYEIRQTVFPLAEDTKGYGGRMIGGVYYLTFNNETMPKNIQNFVYEGILPEGEEKE